MRKIVMEGTKEGRRLESASYAFSKTSHCFWPQALLLSVLTFILSLFTFISHLSCAAQLSCSLFSSSLCPLQGPTHSQQFKPHPGGYNRISLTNTLGWNHTHTHMHARAHTHTHACMHSVFIYLDPYLMINIKCDIIIRRIRITF